MRVEPIMPIQPTRNHLKRAMVVQRYDQWHIRDRETKETYIVNADVWWEMFCEIENRGILV